MFASPVSFLSLLLFAASAVSAPTARTESGSIVAPTSGTVVQPGANFTFTYFPRADYGVSTFAYQVWLLTKPDAAGSADADQISLTTPGVSGYFFGRFDYPNYPAVPYAQNPAPPQFTMPDFSKAPGGWAVGATASNLPMQLTVIEEWGNGDPTIGRKLSATSTTVIYNATTSA